MAKINELIEICLNQKIPFVSYKLPDDEHIVTLVQYRSAPQILKSLEDLQQKKGFVVAPFSESEQHESYFLEPDCIFLSSDIDENILKELSNNNRFLSLESKQIHNIKTTESLEFNTNVQLAVDAIKGGEFQKVVLSKIRIESMEENFSAVDFFLKLCIRYRTAFVSIVQIPQVGCWVGASPENLLIVEKDTVRTVSMAGTQIASNKDLEDYKWDNKELEEQQIVTDYVDKILNNLQLENITKIGPKNHQAGNLIHLKTTFEFPFSEFEKTALGEVIQALHPTPSVGGLPKKEAKDFIISHENHDRSYYTGFLGPVNIHNKIAVFVNIRCLQLFEKQVVLYSGAGITESSIPENEWTETENKMMTMKSVIINS